MPDPDEAAPIAIVAYLARLRAGDRSTHSATGWPAAGSASGSFEPGSARSATGWPRSTSTGERAYVLAEDLDELASTKPTTAVRLLPGFDQYVLGPGTDDGHVVAAGAAGRGEQAERLDRAGRRGRRRGVAAPGSWTATGVRVAWFKEAGKPPRTALRRGGRAAVLDPRSRLQDGNRERLTEAALS